ncbi:MAG TPA: PaaI family thioesterase [Candidatus Dormibacteraeota bacterium]|nr:PaaI family thioesterase [Candidatus Dormibacteraeota bacterium]
MSQAKDFSRCYGCGEHNPTGLHLRQHSRRVGDDIVIDANLGPFFAGFPGVAHAGVVATMLDEAIQMQATGVLGLEAPTVQLNIAYKAPVPTEAPVQVRGRGARDGNKVMATGEVTDADGQLLASAEAVLVVTGDAGGDRRTESEE